MDLPVGACTGCKKNPNRLLWLLPTLLYIFFFITTAVEGHKEVNSAVCCKAAGLSSLLITQ
jgi:hypothetical protein